MKIIYVCHNQESVDVCIKKDPNAYIFLVGPSKVNYTGNKMIVSRDLLYNIEDEQKLLTFTAWYAIIKNNLFSDEKHICIVEWDTHLPNLDEYCNMNEDIGAFFTDRGYNFLLDIIPDVLTNFLNSKSITYDNPVRPWNCSTNYIIRRTLLEQFVDFYYPSCIELIKSHDTKKFSWYHERIFAVFLENTKSSILNIPGACHLGLGSHITNFINIK